jgi:hypothetical protein
VVELHSLACDASGVSSRIFDSPSSSRRRRDSKLLLRGPVTVIDVEVCAVEVLVSDTEAPAKYEQVGVLQDWRRRAWAVDSESL